MSAPPEEPATHPEQRRRAVAELEHTRDPGRVAALVAALGDDDWRVRKEAIRVAVAVSAQPELVRALLDVFDASDDVGLRNAAVEVLARLGEAAIEALTQRLPGLDADGRKLALEVLGRSGDERALPAVEFLRHDRDENVRLAALDALVLLGEVNLPLCAAWLAEHLTAQSLAERQTALEGLNQLAATLPWERLEPLLEEPQLRRAALVTAGQSADGRALPWAARALGAEGRALREAGLVALAQLIERAPGGAASAARELRSQPPRALDVVYEAASAPALEQRRSALVVLGVVETPEALRRCVEALSDDRIAEVAAGALLGHGERAGEPLARLLLDEPALVSALAVEVLGRLSAPPLTPCVRAVLLRALESEELELRVVALTAFGQLGDAAALSDVAGFLAGHHPPAVRRAAAAGLGAIAQRFPEAARALVAAAAPTSDAAPAAVAVMAALGGGRGSTARDVEYLTLALASPDATLRHAAVTALGKLGSHLGLTAVVFALSDEELEVQLAALRALGELRAPDGGAVGKDALLRVLRDEPEVQLVAAAVEALGATRDAQVGAEVRRLMRDNRPAVAVAAVAVMAAFTDEASIASLLEALSHPATEVVKAALSALAGAAEARVTAHLGAALDHEAWDVRRLAADLLGLREGALARELLLARLRTEQEPLVIDALQRALGRPESPARRRASSPELGSLR